MSILFLLQRMLARLTWRAAFYGIIATFGTALFVLFVDWVVINWISGCCDGGTCIPEWVYPQCHAHGGHHAE